MSRGGGVLEELGGLFRYPDESYLARLGHCREQVVAGAYPERAATGLATIEEALEGKATWEIEELHTQAFDLNPVCALEIGWHLYGEQYERGRFLVRTRDLLAELEIEEVVELPDHLSTMLAALGRLEGADGKAFAANFVAPALRRMAKACDGSANPVLQLIVVARELAEQKAAEVPIKEAPPLRQDLVQLGAGRKSTSAGRPIA